MKYNYLILTSFLLWLPCAFLFFSQSFAQGQERPFIWVKAEDKPEILEKIARNTWAKELFESLRERADKATSSSMEERCEKLMVLPLDWSKGKDSAPTLRVYGAGEKNTINISNKELMWGLPKEGQVEMIQALQDGIDCGVLYYLTEDVKYAEAAADILSVFVNAIAQMEVEEGYFNGGLIYHRNHLLEARIIGAQIPIIYDLIHPYLVKGGKVYNVAGNDLRDFDFEAAQTVFRTYVYLALNRGIIKLTNWPVLEAPSLVHNLLALDDKNERKENLPYYLNKDTERQQSLLTVSKNFKDPGDIWPESLGYSRHSANYTFYLMTLLDRIYSDLDLGTRYKNIPEALSAYYNLQFPNEAYPSIGDGSRYMRVEYLFYEIALQLAAVNNNQKQIKTFSEFLSSSIENGRYNRGSLHPRNSGASPYLTPLQLLWSIDDLGKITNTEEINFAPPRPRANHLSHAGLYIQRIISGREPVKNSLMAVISGATYIHAHASGMDLELYGQGHVLGTEGGHGNYGSNIHINYYRLFAAHNTVISNGASGSKGPWLGLGIDTVKQVTMEPSPDSEAVSPRHSFMTARFCDVHNLVAPAHHQRTVALIKLSDSQGYYLDVFRARSDTPEQFHDYVYHNFGDDLTLKSGGDLLTMTSDEQRYQASAKLSWSAKDDYYQHPGWHFFKDVKTGKSSDKSVEAIFTANKLGDKPIYMRAMIPGGLETEITRAMAPESHAADKPYNHMPLPTLIIRRIGDAWKNPFAVVYESCDGRPSVQSVERLMADGVFKGVKVVSKVEGRIITQYILIQESMEDEYINADTGFIFKGRFGVITLEKAGALREAYIGNGRKLSYKDVSLIADETYHSAYLEK